MRFSNRFIVSGLFIFLLGFLPLSAQPDISLLSLKIGSIRNLQDASFAENNQRSLYPELEIGGKLLNPSLRWSAYWGFWDDGISEPLPVADLITYSYSSNVVGARIIYAFSEDQSGRPLPLKLGFFTGYSHHFVEAQYIAGGDFTGDGGEDFSGEFSAFDFGVQLSFKLRGAFNLLIEMEQFIPINPELSLLNTNRRVYKTGLNFNF